MPTGAKLERKNAYMAKLVRLVEESPLALIVGVDHVGSKQMQHIRTNLRGACTLLMGKNTMIRTALRKRIEEIDDESASQGLSNLLTSINGNMGFIFCQAPGSMEKAREALEEFVVPANAKAGIIAPKDVVIPAGPSGLEPSQTSFFQALNIPTKIVKGAIEITTEAKVVVEGEKVSLSAQTLLAKMGIRPFEYGMKVLSVYQDGAVFDAAVLDIDDNVLVQKFMAGVSNMAAFGREIGVPTEAGLPHMVCNAFKNMVALVADIDYCFEQAQEIKDVLGDPEKLAAMKAAASSGNGNGGTTTGGGTAAPAAAAAEEVEEEEMEFDLFD